MIRFNCDYNEGAHERILKKLAETNLEQTPGYGEDHYCLEAADIIRKLCKKEDAAVHFLVGGTQTNLTVISSALRPYQGVVGAVSAHVNVHETGAIEATGHKVIALPSEDGKITAEQVEKLWLAHITDDSFEHMVQPKMVYISHPTELGTLYKKAELEELYRVCRKYGLYLFVDGARLGYGLAATGNDIDLADLADNCDVFYIGGTKVGALFGEAVVITNPDLKKDFRYYIKQKGGMLAKGRLLGIQFGELLRDGLYMELGAHADRLADSIREALEKKGYPFLVYNTTNQIFPILPDSLIEKWKEKYACSYQERVDETHSAVRICTSWATKEEQAEALIKDISEG
jgi:threonine aldolase